MHGLSRTWMAALAVMIMAGGADVAHAAKPKGLAIFKGSRKGAFLIAQGQDTRVVGIAEIKVLSDKSGRNGTIRINGTLGQEKFPTQTFKLRRGKASVNVLLPGIESFAIPAKGAYKVRGRRLQIDVESAAPGSREMAVTLQFQPGGETISLSGLIDVGGSSAPVYLSIFGT